MKLYHLSSTKLPDNYKMTPRIPKSEFEEQDTPRICFAPTIQGCLIGACEDKDLTNQYFYVYSIDTNNYYQPTQDEVQDVEATGEVWILYPVIPTFNGIIHITGKLSNKLVHFANNDFEVPIWNYVFINNPNRLHEDTRTQLLSASRNAGPYKMFNPIYKNRFARKKLSKFVNQVKSYNQINMDQLFKKDTLEVSIPVIGETANYDITFKWNGVIAELANNIKSNQNKFEHKVILQALINSFNKANVYVKCTCDDFKYRFKHWSIINNWGADDTSQDPGPGKGLANPKNDKGKGCKHILLCLNNLDWIIKVASCLKNYITYLDKNNHNLFMKIIFPKLYPSNLIDTIQKEEAKTDTEMDKLTTAPDFIDVINNWAKNRGKFVKGSNKNPAASK